MLRVGLFVGSEGDTQRWLVETIRRQAGEAGIGMPEVAVYDAPEMNAFATGMSRNNALVAVSTALLWSGILDRLDPGADRTRHPGEHGGHVVLALARVPGGRRRRAARGTPEDDRCPQAQSGKGR